jgi:hypothetical protein
MNSLQIEEHWKVLDSAGVIGFFEDIVCPLQRTQNEERPTERFKVDQVP